MNFWRRFVGEFRFPRRASLFEDTALGRRPSLNNRPRLGKLVDFGCQRQRIVAWATATGFALQKEARNKEGRGMSQHGECPRRIGVWPAEGRYGPSHSQCCTWDNFKYGKVRKSRQVAGASERLRRLTHHKGATAYRSAPPCCVRKAICADDDASEIRHIKTAMMSKRSVCWRIVTAGRWDWQRDDDGHPSDPSPRQSAQAPPGCGYLPPFGIGAVRIDSDRWPPYKRPPRYKTRASGLDKSAFSSSFAARVERRRKF